MTILFTAWGYDVTALEFVAVVLALTSIALGIQGTRWTWPLYLAGSVLYGILFLQFDLLASAALQLVFIVAAIWGWFTWGAEGVREPAELSSRNRRVLLVGILVAWVVTAPLLQAVGGAATWLDSLILIGSLAAQVLMVKEYVDAWLLWVVVDVIGVFHYANQGLWFTALFYAVLVAMAVVGWRAWTRRRNAVLMPPAARYVQ